MIQRSKLKRLEFSLRDLVVYNIDTSKKKTIHSSANDPMQSMDRTSFKRGRDESDDHINGYLDEYNKGYSGDGPDVSISLKSFMDERDMQRFNYRPPGEYVSNSNKGTTNFNAGNSNKTVPTKTMKAKTVPNAAKVNTPPSKPNDNVSKKSVAPTSAKQVQKIPPQVQPMKGKIQASKNKWNTSLKKANSVNPSAISSATKKVVTKPKVVKKQ
jgi:hypothetical protein